MNENENKLLMDEFKGLYMTVDEVAELRGVNRLTVHKWARYRGLPHITLCNNVTLFRRRDAIQYKPAPSGRPVGWRKPMSV